MNFELLDHPADIGFRARGATLAELFSNCAHALVFIVLDPSNIHLTQSVSITSEGRDRESLLVNWLNEVLYYTDSRRLALGAFQIASLTDTRIDAVALGEPRDREKHSPKLDVKAVTYHQLKIFQGAGATAWTAEVYVDV